MLARGCRASRRAEKSLDLAVCRGVADGVLRDGAAGEMARCSAACRRGEHRAGAASRRRQGARSRRALAADRYARARAAAAAHPTARRVRRRSARGLVRRRRSRGHARDHRAHRTLASSRPTHGFRGASPKRRVRFLTARGSNPERLSSARDRKTDPCPISIFPIARTKRRRPATSHRTRPKLHLPLRICRCGFCWRLSPWWLAACSRNERGAGRALKSS